MPMRLYLLTALLAFAACAGEGAGQTTSVRQGAANTNFTPAFAGQTRAPEQISGVRLKVETIAEGLERPWAAVFLPDGRLLVTERAGRLRTVTRAGEISAPISGLPEILVRGQGGLLDVVLSPGFAQDRLVYWTFSQARANGANTTAVARGRLSEDATRVENARVIFQQEPAWDSGGHFGSRLVFDSAGRLFVVLGDRQQDGSRELAQDVSTHIGKIVRINADGTTPADNPFVGRAGARGEVWSYGHRNIQGADLHPETGALWTIEHGPQGGDELNAPRAGRNYGWPVISYGEEYRGAPVNGGIAVQEGMEQPIYYWDPVIAPGDMDFYRGALFPWRGDILIAGLRTQSLTRLRLDGERVVGEERFDIGARVRDVAESEDGALWLITDDQNGRLLRVTPAP